MPSFILSVAVVVASSSLALSALESGDVHTALLRFGIAALAAVVVARTFRRGVFESEPDSRSMA